MHPQMPPQRPMPQYGQPQYGPPPGYQPQRDNTRRVLIWVLVAVAITAVGVVVLLLTTSSKTPTLSTVQVEQDAQGILNENGITGTLTNVQCPTMEAAKGDTYSCTGDVDLGGGATEQVKITVTFQDDEGAYYLEVSGY